MKKFVFVWSILAIILFPFVITLSCSDSDAPHDNGVEPLPTDTLRIDSLPEIGEKVCSIENGGIIMTYCLINIQGDTTVTFSEGEEIIFNLSIRNTTNDYVSIPGFSNTLGYNTFRVFTSSGTDCGVSWSYVQKWTKEMPYFLPQMTYHYQCPWYSDDTIKATEPFVFKESPKALTRGYYFTEAYCYLDDGATLYCKVNFNIE